MTPRCIVALAMSAVLLAAVSLAAAGCGKKGGLQAPPEKKDEYTYPRKYPR